MFVNRLAYRFYIDTMALRVAGHLKEICMARVMSTEQSKPLVQQHQEIANGGFTDRISASDNQGRILSERNAWDRRLGTKFRSSTWPETKVALDTVRTELEGFREP
jgi:hypothetical protein